MKFSKIPTDTFKNLQLGAGMLLKAFNQSEGSYEMTDLLGATTGGLKFSAVPTYKDFGEDIDNCPKNMKELKKLISREIKLSGNFLTATPELVKRLLGAATVSGEKVTPTNDLLIEKDFEDIWLLCDYSDKTGAMNGGYIAIHMMNTLSTGGFELQTKDGEKGQFAFEFTAHYSMDAQETVPFEVFVKEGAPEA